MNQAKSLVRGELVSGEQVQPAVSPIDGLEIAEVHILSTEKLDEVFLKAKEQKDTSIKKDFEELKNLANYFRQNHKKFTEQIMLDAGFTVKDSKDLVDCSIEFCEDYSKHLNELPNQEVATTFSFQNNGSDQKINFTSAPYGLISATTPRNTPLITELTIIVHALWSGNVIVLRPSPGVAGTVSLLIEGFQKSFSKESLDKLNIVFSNAKEFVNASLNYADLLHYVGSTKYLETTLIAGIEKGVKVLLDGDGCSQVVVDSSADINAAAQACYEGLIRCNGQICISVRSIIVNEKVYNEFRSRFLELIKQTKVESPSATNSPDMGPLFSAFQVDNIKSVAQKYNVISGLEDSYSQGENYISPIVLELERNTNSLLKESVFGPIVSISSYSGEEWKKLVKDNKINLTDVVFSSDKEFIQDFLNTSTSPRRVVNLDPTLESVFEPWGAFLPSGWNDVSYWYSKYRNYYQIVSKK